MGSSWGRGEAKPLTVTERIQMALSFTIIGGMMVIVGQSMMEADAATTDLPSQVYVNPAVDPAHDDAITEGRDVPPCDDGYYLAVDGLCWPGKVVYAPDGTVTINNVHPDGTVSGTVIRPDGTSFTFEPGGN